MARKMPPDTSYVRFAPHPAFRSEGLSPLLVTGILVHELRQHFSSSDRIEDPRARGYVWRPMRIDPAEPSPADSAIRIEPWSKPDKRQAGMTPGIVVKREQYSGTSRFLNSDAYTTNMAGMEMPLAGDEHTMVVSGRHSVGIVAEEPAVSEILLWEVFRHLACFHDPIMQEYGFGEFVVEGVSELNHVESNRNGFDVAVMVKYAFNMNWVVAEVAPRMSGAVVEAGIGKGYDYGVQ